MSGSGPSGALRRWGRALVVGARSRMVCEASPPVKGSGGEELAGRRGRRVGSSRRRTEQVGGRRR